jgi:hypothetical protein
MSKKYVIIETSEVDSVNFNEVIETEAQYLRYSIDGNKTFVKYEGVKPSFLSGKTDYTHSEILAILSGDEWSTSE